ncbi:replication initiation protein [Butyrivibrio sp. NC3005]|uniref:replication initiation protein n=1 Tax=Butyrivibrio sp. NC3005 TaxID=1280685 RepID=UPI0004066C83|nr:replication initiation protein [Butyrivibrio sp. NC3005]
MPSNTKNTSTNLMPKSGNYKKTNFLIGAKYHSTLMENKILAVALSKIQQAQEDDKGNLVVRLPASDLRKVFNDKNRNLYKQLNEVAHTLTGRVIGATDPEMKRFDYISLVSRCTYEDNILQIKFNGELKNQIVDIKEKYTLLNLPMMLKFRSVYSFRLYEILKSEAYKASYHSQNNMFGYDMHFSLSELKLDLGIVDANDQKVRQILSDKSIPDYDKAVQEANNQVMAQWKDLRRWVIDKAIPEINEMTELEVTYDTDRAGRGGKIVGITFHVETSKIRGSSQPKAQEIKEVDIFELVDEVIELITEKITAREAKSIIEAANGDMAKVQRAYTLYKSQKNVDNMVGWLISAIRDEYQEGIRKSNEAYMNKAKYVYQDTFEQNVYDFDELEKNLLKN